jgi:diphthamide biosynthesis protein 3
MDSYYFRLGVEVDATDEQIRQAYRALALQLHPDKCLGKIDQFNRIQKAYEVLRDDRPGYDRKLKEIEASRIGSAVSADVMLDEMFFCDSKDTYEWACRCGSMFSVAAEDLSNGFDIHNCPFCSLNIRVIYETDSNVNST